MTDDQLANIDALVAQITSSKERAELAARAAEEASSKANSESGFAYNAKQNAEEHAKAIAQVRGAVDADFAWLTTAKKNAEELVQAIAASKSTSDGDARAAAASKAAAEKVAISIQAASDRTAALLAAIEKSQNDVTAALKKVAEESASVTVAKATADAGAGAIQTLQTQVGETASKATASAVAAAKSEAEANTLHASMTNIATTAKITHERVIEYENSLNQFVAQFTELHGKIEGLLPGAASAGLATSFRNQKARFLKPQRYWLYTFVVAIILLLAAGMIGLPGFSLWPPTSAGQETWDSILRHLATRLPIVAPLVWLAIYAGRHYTLALRVEEEYAFKEAVSAAFEGYKREMAGISGAGSTATPPILSLCENVLRTLAQRPGRIYEGRHEDITPITPLANVITDAVNRGHQ